jgi:hypothetical protein
MNNKFDELTKSMAQSVTRRAALKKFGVGLAGMALACFGLANKGKAAHKCATDADCPPSQPFCLYGHCVRQIFPYSTDSTESQTKRKHEQPIR